MLEEPPAPATPEAATTAVRVPATTMQHRRRAPTTACTTPGDVGCHTDLPVACACSPPPEFDNPPVAFPTHSRIPRTNFSMSIPLVAATAAGPSPLSRTYRHRRYHRDRRLSCPIDTAVWRACPLKTSLCELVLRDDAISVSDSTRCWGQQRVSKTGIAAPTSMRLRRIRERIGLFPKTLARRDKSSLPTESAPESDSR